MVKGCLKVSIHFKTDTLATHNAQLVISDHSYVEVFFTFPGPDHFNITVFSCTLDETLAQKIDFLMW